MIFFFKKQPIVVDLFTARPEIFAYAKPQLAIKYLPDWWKALPKSLVDEKGVPGGSMKTCLGFIDLYKNGFIVPMWSDLLVRVTEIKELQWQFADRQTEAVCHPAAQAGTLYADSKIVNMKFTNPWVAKTKQKIAWQIMHPLWNQNFQMDWIVPPGVVFLNERHAINVNTFVLDIEKPRTFQIDRNTPIMHMVPLSDRPLKIKHHLISQDEFKQFVYKGINLSFVNSVLKNKLNAQTK